MPMSTEYRLGAEECLWLANQTEQLYAKEILLEMAAEFLTLAEHVERCAHRSRGRKIRQVANRFDRSQPTGKLQLNARVRT